MTSTYSRHDLWDTIEGGGPYNPFDWQKEIHAHADTRFLLAACGRRGGKTSAVVPEVVRAAFEKSVTALGKTHYPLIYVVAPTAELSMRVWQPVWDLFVPDERGENIPPLGIFYKNHDKTRRIIWLKNGAVIQGKSADDPKTLQGERVTCAVVDEAQDMPEDAWSYLLPAFMDSGGRLLAIGIAKGKNRFRSMWERGHAGDAGFWSISVPSTAHPLIFLTEAEAIKAREIPGLENAASLEFDPSFLALTETEQRQQYFAEWIEDDGSVFAKATIDKCATGHYLDDPDDDGIYVAGLDVAKSEDWTVLMIGDIRTGQIVHTERMNRIEYMTQAPRIAAVCRDWNVRMVHMDVTSNLAVAEIFREEGVPLSEFVFTNKSKNNIVNITIREMERGNLTLPAEDDVLLRELELFQKELSASGNIKFSAPPGYHDDMVDALCLLVAKMARNKGMSKSPLQKPYASWSSSANKSYMPPLPKPEVAAA